MRAYNTRMWYGMRAERPDHGELGWTFFAVDEARWYVWSGTRWIGHMLGAQLAAACAVAKLCTNMLGAEANAWIDISAEDGDELVDFSSRQQFRISARWQPRALLGGGVQELRWIDRASGSVLHAFTNITGGPVTQSFDSGWLDLPAWAAGDAALAWQMRSTNITDDPFAVGWKLLLR